MFHTHPATFIDPQNTHPGRPTYVQIEEVLDHLGEQHRRLRQLYREQAEALRGLANSDAAGSEAAGPEAAGPGSAASERLALLYDYAAGRQDGMRSFLARFSEEERRRILQRWLQYADTSKYDELTQETIESPPTSSSELRDRLVALDRELVSTFERFSEQVDGPNAVELFEHLAQVAGQRMRNHAEHLPQVEDL